MKPLVLLKIKGAEALPEGQGAFIDMETSGGRLESRCTFEDSEKLVDALQSARAVEKGPATWETAIGGSTRTRSSARITPDRPTQETRIPRNDVAEIARFLQQAATRFAVSAEMRQ